MLPSLRQTFLFLILVLGSYQQVKIKCYDCVTPLGIDDATGYCNASLYCKGMYCTKGPDALSNAMYHGCVDNPPLDKAGASCKKVSNVIGTHTNCYCKNIDYCNDAPNGRESLMLVIMLLVLTFFYLLLQ